MGDFTNKLTKKSNQSNPMQQPQVNIDISKSKLIKCECGNPYFQQVVIFREVSGILVGQAGKNVQSPMQVLICRKCEKPHVASAPYLQEGNLEKEEVKKPELEIVGK